MLRFIKKYRALSKLAEEHHRIPTITAGKEHLGIILTILGWLSYALFTVLFEREVEMFHIKVSESLFQLFLEFSLFHFFMFLVFFAFSIPYGLRYFKSKEPVLLYWRVFFAVTGFWAYSFARVWTNTIDNSLLYSTDAGWVIVILMLLGIKISKISVTGIAISLIGVVAAFLFLRSTHDVFGGILGAFSGFSLAVLTVITSYLIKQDPPLRIGLYQSSIGCISSFLLAIVFGFVQGWKLHINFTEILTQCFSGFTFAFTLFCIWEAFYYIESYIIGALSFSLPVFLIVLGWILNSDQISPQTLLCSLIISLGSVLVIFDSYKRNKEIRKIHFADSNEIKKI